MSAAACGGSGDGGGQPISEDLIGAEYYAELSEFQKSILADGRVAFPEYERAILALIACLEGDGLLIDGFQLNDEQVYEYAYGVPHGSPINANRVAQLFRDCDAEYTSAVESLWQTTFAPSAIGIDDE